MARAPLLLPSWGEISIIGSDDDDEEEEINGIVDLPIFAIAHPARAATVVLHNNLTFLWVPQEVGQFGVRTLETGGKRHQLTQSVFSSLFPTTRRAE